LLDLVTQDARCQAASRKVRNADVRAGERQVITLSDRGRIPASFTKRFADRQSNRAA